MSYKWLYFIIHVYYTKECSYKFITTFFATRIRINVSWGGSRSGQMIRIQPDPDPKDWTYEMFFLQVRVKHFYLGDFPRLFRNSCTVYLYTNIIVVHIRMDLSTRRRLNGIRASHFQLSKQKYSNPEIFKETFAR